MSPVNDAYRKPGLLPSKHRIEMCQLACECSELTTVDAWESQQAQFVNTLTVCPLSFQNMA